MGISGDTWILVAAAVVLIVSHNLAAWTRQKELMKVNLSINEHLHGISHLVTEISLERRGSGVFEEINENLKQIDTKLWYIRDGRYSAPRNKFTKVALDEEGELIE